MNGSEICISTDNNSQFELIIRFVGLIGSNYVEHLFQNVDDMTGVTIYDKFTYAYNPKNYQEF